ncbi:phage terminase small subunit P27 family [Spirosoma aureum]|uniref:Phage terminase small subunit P27 family n=1 Tax=Spirosoma aureum TaxID=2692134 RepID=A0A6G9AIG4_9BACT|nr:phage terminase small subunit P27 family [Spirosoma aureum]QIP12240.1 phage terminase small subunit P27 family [Spirosoma aureum]
MPNPRKSQAEKELTGTARRDRTEPVFVQPAPVETLPEPPPYLTKTGRKQWKKYLKLLQNEGILAETDLDSLGLYCMHLQIAEEAAEELKKGVVRECRDETGKVYYVETPNLLKIFNEASAAALKYSQQFGFTPVSRKNVAVPRKKERPSRLQELINKRDPANPGVFKLA